MAISALFESEGPSDYLGERVSQAQHMLQAAHLATLAGEPDTVVAAALLHDVGHFRGTLTGADLMAGIDNHHSETGAAWLSQWFGSEVTEPVRLHVAAKRYLCAIRPSYLEELSPASLYTLSVQGGPMESEEVASFESLPYATEAIRLRGCDERAKDPDRAVPPLGAYRDLLEALAARRAPVAVDHRGETAP